MNTVYKFKNAEFIVPDTIDLSDKNPETIDIYINYAIEIVTGKKDISGIILGCPRQFCDLCTCTLQYLEAEGYLEQYRVV